MQFPYGYPTPPASPSPLSIPKYVVQQHQQAAVPPCQSRFVPPAPEERLGRFLAGTLQLTGILGTGAYGVVYSAVDVKTNVRYAVKTLSKYNADGSPLDRRQVAFQHREIRLHWLASAHPNVVSMHKIIDDPDCTYVILEYCPEGDLFYNITECGQYVGKDDLAKRVFLQILDAVGHCHSQGIYHRDLKPENILVSNQGETVKLADFGLATSSDRSEDYGCGSTFYMSPECLDHTTRRPYYFCAPNDVWSLGVILVNLTCGRNPWKQASFDDQTYRAYTRNQGFLRSILPISEELNDILSRIFTRNPDERITLAELKARIAACSRFTEQPQQAPQQLLPQQQQQQCTSVLPLSPPTSPAHLASYVDYEEAIIDDEDEELDYASDASSTCFDDGASITSSCPAIDDDLDDEDEELVYPEPRGAVTPPPEYPEGSAVIYDQETPQLVGYPPEYVHFHQHHQGHVSPVILPEPLAVATPVQPVPIHVPVHHFAACAPKAPVPSMPAAPCFNLHFLDAVYKYALPAAAGPLGPIHHQPHPAAFHHQVPLPVFACH